MVIFVIINLIKFVLFVNPEIHPVTFPFLVKSVNGVPNPSESDCSLPVLEQDAGIFKSDFRILLYSVESNESESI